MSAVLIVSFLQPVQRFGINIARRGEANLESHVFVNPRGSQTSDQFLTIKSKAEVYAVLSRGLHTRECPATYSV